MRQWRLIYGHPTPGVRNMALDDSLLTSGLPTLRLYAWQPDCLSIGYGQRVADIDRVRVQACGWDVVRRPSGGRAILHADELTYCVVLPKGDPIAVGEVIESYRRVSRALVAGLEGLGVDSKSALADQGRRQAHAVCFETASHYEITVAGRKLVGSAQLRRGAGVLQHGSIPLGGDPGRICDGLYYANEMDREAGRQKVRARAITLREALAGRAVTWREAAEAVVAGFREVFEIDFCLDAMTDDERERAATLEQTRYGSAAWTERH